MEWELTAPLPLPALSPCCGAPLAFRLPQLHSHCPGPFHAPGMAWAFCFPSSVLPPFLSSIPVSWTTLKLPAPRTEVPLLPPHFLLLKARLSYRQNYSQVTGSDGCTRPVFNDRWGDKSEVAQLRRECRHPPGQSTHSGHSCVFTGLSALLPVPSTARSHGSLVHWPQDLAEGPRRVGR